MDKEFMDPKFLEKLLNPNRVDILKHVHPLTEIKEGKITVKGFILKPQGVNYDDFGLIQTATSQIERFILGENETAKVLQDKKTPYKEALRHMGHAHPISDGKYGELLLYLLVEAVLDIPMVALKLSNISSPNEQAKGSDGMFLGMHGSNMCRMIGESKIKNDFGDAVDEFIESLERFSDDILKSAFEGIIARRAAPGLLSDDEMQFIANHFDSTKDECRNSILVHPVLVGYTEAQINEFYSEDHGDIGVSDFSQKFYSQAESLLSKKKDSIKRKLENSRIKEVVLIVFILPLRCSERFRFNFYKELHQTPHSNEAEYFLVKEEKKSKTPKLKKSNKEKK